MKDLDLYEITVPDDEIDEDDTDDEDYDFFGKKDTTGTKENTDDAYNPFGFNTTSSRQMTEKEKQDKDFEEWWIYEHYGKW